MLAPTEILERRSKVELGNQRIGVKKMKKCARILHKSVMSGFSNGSLPHGIVLAFVDPSEAYLVNLKLGLAWPYLYNSRFVLRRAKDLVIEKQVETTERVVHRAGELDVLFTPEGQMWEMT
jgi:hypothetical protein